MTETFQRPTHGSRRSWAIASGTCVEQHHPLRGLALDVQPCQTCVRLLQCCRGRNIGTRSCPRDRQVDQQVMLELQHGCDCPGTSLNAAASTKQHSLVARAEDRQTGRNAPLASLACQQPPVKAATLMGCSSEECTRFESWPILVWSRNEAAVEEVMRAASETIEQLSSFSRLASIASQGTLDSARATTPLQAESHMPASPRAAAQDELQATLMPDASAAGTF